MNRDILGIPSHIEQYGKHGPQVLLLHGWGPGVVHLKSHLQPVAQALQGACRVTAVDFPAHGQTGNPPAPWGVAEYAAWTLALIQELDLAPVAIVAHSFGGRIALHLAARQPQVVRSLVITGGAGLRREQTPEEKKRAQAYQKQKAALENMKSHRLLRPMIERVEESMRRRHGSADYLALPAELRPTLVKIVNEDLRPLLAEVKQPVMLVWGEKDDATPLWMGQTMQQELADAGLEVFKGRGHFAYLEELDRFCSIVKALVKEDGTSA